MTAGHTMSIFPVSEVRFNGKTYREASSGLTKRELFAAMAMQGFIGFPGVLGGSSHSDEYLIAKYAVRYADALLDALTDEEVSK